jgi:hypothetical protein
MNELVAELAERIKKKTQKIISGQDVIVKELRIYNVNVPSCLVRNIVNYLPNQNCFSNIKARHDRCAMSNTFIRYRTLEDMEFPSASVDSLLLSFLYTGLEPIIEEKLTLKVRVSRKSLDSNNDPLCVALTACCDQFLFDKGRIMDFKELVQLQNKQILNLLPTGHLFDSPYFYELAVIVTRNNLADTVDLLMNLQNKFGIVPEKLELLIKLYVNRGDYRAYYRDSDLLRTFSGSIIAALLNNDLPESLDAEWRQIYPKKYQNVLNITFELGDDEDCYLLLGDISSFTASFLGCWVGIFVILSLLLYNDNLKHLLYSFVVQINSSFISANIVDVLAVYLILTVGCPANISGSNIEHRTTGGYLGVAGNINMSLYVCAIIYLEIKAKLNSQFKARNISQLGGDDFIQIICGKTGSNLKSAYEWTKNKIINEIGNIKEPYELMIPKEEVDVYLKTRFCQKMVRLRVKIYNGKRIVYITTESGLPIMSHMVEPVPQFKCQDAYIEYINGLSDHFKLFPQKSMLLQIYSDAFTLRHNFIPSDISTKSFIGSVDHFLVQKKFLFSKEAFKLMQIDKYLTDKNNEIYTLNFHAKLTILTSDEDIEYVRCYDPYLNLRFNAFILISEKGNYGKYVEIKQKLPFIGGPISEEISELFREFYNNISVYI